MIGEGSKSKYIITVAKPSQLLTYITKSRVKEAYALDLPNVGISQCKIASTLVVDIEFDKTYLITVVGSTTIDTSMPYLQILSYGNLFAYLFNFY